MIRVCHWAQKPWIRRGLVPSLPPPSAVPLQLPHRRPDPLPTQGSGPGAYSGGGAGRLHVQDVPESPAGRGRGGALRLDGGVCQDLFNVKRHGGHLVWRWGLVLARPDVTEAWRSPFAYFVQNGIGHFAEAITRITELLV